MVLTYDAYSETLEHGWSDICNTNRSILFYYDNCQIYGL